jgi:hypothetical protein
MIYPGLTEEDFSKLTERFEREIGPLVQQRALEAAIRKTEEWLEQESRSPAKRFLLSELRGLLWIDGQDEKALEVIRASIALTPDDPLAWSQLAGWHFYGHGLYGANDSTLSAALDAIEMAISLARPSGGYLRYCLNDRARIAVAFRRYGLLEETLREILDTTQEHRVTPEIRLEDDFLQRVPNDAIDEGLRARYCAAVASEREKAKPTNSPPKSR